MIAFLVVMLACGSPGPEDAARLSASDLPAYRAALELEDRGNEAPVDFRTLWNHDEAYRNRRVRLEGRIVRRFSQPPVGAFPALTEFWVADDRGELICVVVPTPSTISHDIPSNSHVLFRGTYLRPIRYPAAGGDRVAPLVVASKGPETAKRVRFNNTRFKGEGWVAAALAVLVAVILLVQFLKRPSRKVRNPGKPPTFLQAGEEEPTHGDES